MKEHFEAGIHVKDMLLSARPCYVLELGAGGGDNTTKLLSLQPTLGFKLVVVNDSPAPEGMEFPGLDSWIYGVSYLEVPKLLSGVDFCLIDTDHNYWTLKQELRAVSAKMPKGGLICCHDTLTYGRNTGKSYSYYRVDHPYPLAQIEEAERAGKGMLDAIAEAQEFRVIRETDYSHGAMVLEKIA